MNQAHYAHGKLLLCGEYAVLDGALALAVPTRPGQWLRTRPHDAAGLHWTSLDHEGAVWFEATFAMDELTAPFRQGGFPGGMRERMLYLLQAAARLNPMFPDLCSGTAVETRLEFDRGWGLGTSSTLVSNLAAWAGVDPFHLLELTFGGSGYDLACARSSGPLFYQLAPNGTPVVEPVPLHYPFSDSLYFVYLNAKQDSREGIARYRRQGSRSRKDLAQISALGQRMAGATDLDVFRSAMEDHEALLSVWLGLPTVKERLFPDFDGSIKSLGAWGGDFILAAGGTDPATYFQSKGYPTRLGWSDLVLA